MNKQQDELVKNYQALKKKPRSEEALTLLKRLASQVKPILKFRNWTIKNLCEFFPTNPNLLGVNVNRGWKINLRLRPHFDETQFLEYEDILGTLLHEMAHIVRGPHDEIFYKLLEELKQETEILIASGYKGEGFYSDGHQLGSKSVPQYLSKQIAAAAAEKRLQTAKIMLPIGGVRLGGNSSPLLKNMTPTQRAASAAEKRLLDKIWCGGSIDVEQDSSPSSSTASSPIASSSSASSSINSNKRKLNSNATGPIMIGDGNTKERTPTTTKKSRVTIDLTDKDHHNDIKSTTTNKDDDSWTCPMCTFINIPLLLACQVCLSTRPVTMDQQNIPHFEEDTAANNKDYWKCPQCTLLNENKWTACTACAYINLK